VLQHNVFSFFVLVPFDDLVPGYFFAILFRDAFIIHRTQVAFSKQSKTELLFPSRRTERDRNVNQTKTDAAFPDCACHIKKYFAARTAIARLGGRRAVGTILSS